MNLECFLYNLNSYSLFGLGLGLLDDSQESYDSTRGSARRKQEADQSKAEDVSMRLQRD
jgi:hypothetical protein